MSTPVVISGMGAICAAGKNIEEISASFSAGQRAPQLPTLFSTALDYPVFEVKGFSARAGIMRTLALAFTAAAEALTEAGFSQGLRGMRAGVCLGTTVASQLNNESWYTEYKNTGSASRGAVDIYLKGNIAEAFSEKFEISGPALTVVNACSSGSDAIGVALSWLQFGLCDIVIAGGADELNHVPYCGFGALGVASRQPCMPFDRDRSGLNLGEGAGILVLEKESSARKRGSRSTLYVTGCGAAADAYHLTAPRPDASGLEMAVRSALSQSGIKESDIAFINAHGTATRDNDKAEGRLFARMFGPKVKFISTKGFTGHTLGAAGALEAIFAALGLKKGWIPANIGFANTDEELGVAPLREKTVIKGSYALSTSLAFGGNNAALIIEQKR